jgi:hypothetical protein
MRARAARSVLCRLVLMTRRELLLTALFTSLAACGSSSRAGDDDSVGPDAGTYMPNQVVVLASGEMRPNGVVADEAAVYFISQGASHSSIRKIDLVTQAVTTFVEDAGTAVRLGGDGGHVYFASGATAGRIVAVDKGNGSSVDLATGQTYANAIATDDDAVYWAVTAETKSIVRTVKKDGTGLRDVGYVADLAFYDLVVDTSRVYAMSTNGIIAIDKTTGVVSTVASTPSGGNTNLAQDATSLYVSDRGDNTIKKIAKSGGTPQVLASNQPLPSRLAVTAGGDVYWACRGAGGDGSTTAGVLNKLPAGTSGVLELARGLDHAIEPTLLSHAVIWTVYGPTGANTGAGGSVMAAPL